LVRHCVARVEEVPPESLRRVEAGGLTLCLARAEDGNFYALNDVCTHEDYSLSEGEIWGLDVECPKHGSRFNLETGAVTGLPAVIPAQTFRVEVSDGDVCIEV